MTTEYVAEVLMKRDDISHDEAIDMIKECAEAIVESGYDPFDVDLIVMEHLGLEPDYMFAVLDILEDNAK